MHLKKACPICYSQDLISFNGRPNARCSNCGGTERTRYMYLLLERMGLLDRHKSILHFAPEPGLFTRLSNLCTYYTPVDYDPSQYTNWAPEVVFADLCNVDETIEGTFDLIIHNHVLEHVPFSVPDILHKLRSKLKEGGMMLFSVPIRVDALTVEDCNPEMSHEDRKKLFGQWDHMRIFGDKDVLDVLNGSKGNRVSWIDPLDHITDLELEAACIPNSVHKICGHAMFSVKAAENIESCLNA